MGFYFHRIPSLVQKAFPNHVWRIPNGDCKIFLTFDDGPDPEVTDFVLDTLSQFGACATFFCLGENSMCHPELIRRILSDGHELANHGHRHLDGWKIASGEYLDNIERGEEVLNNFSGAHKIFFRPPYGHFRKFRDTVLWSLMSGDFDRKLSKEKCLSKLMSLTRSGDIVVFHDHAKSFDKLKWVLPKYIDHCIKGGFKFGLISKEI